MREVIEMESPVEVASEIHRQIQALPVQNTHSVRTIRREYTGFLRSEDRAFILELAGILIHEYAFWALPCELVRYHPSAFGTLTGVEIETLGQGIDSWWSVDSFARTISGPAWLRGLVSDEFIHSWACSEDRWWRRAALVSTVVLNLRSKGGFGDPVRTLAVCDNLVSDRDDMVVKAMSWALRELAAVDPDSARSYLQEHEGELAARVRREVRNKLDTGLKNPRRDAMDS